MASASDKLSGSVQQCGFPAKFTRHPDNWPSTATNGNLNPCDAIGDPFVLYDELSQKYQMWYTSFDRTGPPDARINNLGQAFAESSDGLIWDAPVDTDKCVDAPEEANWIDLSLVPDPANWNGNGIETSTVVKDPDGGYRMYFTGNLPTAPGSNVTSNATQIGMATSLDGVTWTEHAINGVATPIITPQQSWETPFEQDGTLIGGPVEPSILWDPVAGIYKLWYAGIGLRVAGDINSWGGFIGYAISVDGIQFTRRSDPVFEPVPGTWEDRIVGHTHVIPDPVAGYHLFYVGISDIDFDCTECFYPRGKIGHAFSADGINWQRNPDNPILIPEAGEFDGNMVFGPSAIIQNGQFMLWYFGGEENETTAAAHFGLATAACKQAGTSPADVATLLQILMLITADEDTPD